MKRLLTGSAITAYAGLSLTAIGTFTSVLTARFMTPSERGTFIAIWVVLLGVAWLSLGGLDQVIVVLSEGSVGRAHQLLESSRKYSLALGLALVIVCFSITFMITHELSTLDRLTASVVAGIAVITTILSQRSLIYLRVAEDYRYWNIARLLPSIIFALLLSLFVILNHLNVKTALFAMVTGNIFLVVFSRILVRREQFQARIEDSKVDEDFNIGIKAIGLKTLFMGLPSFAQGRIDQLFVVAILGSSSISLYASATSLATSTALIGIIGQAYLLGHLSAVHASQRPHILRVWIVRVILITCLILPILFVSGLKLLGVLFGSFYSDAYVPMMILATAGAIVSLTQVFSTYLQVEHQIARISISNYVGLFCLVALIYPCTTIYGLIGTASSVLISTLFGFVILVSLGLPKILSVKSTGLNRPNS